MLLDSVIIKVRNIKEMLEDYLDEEIMKKILNIDEEQLFQAILESSEVLAFCSIEELLDYYYDLFKETYNLQRICCIDEETLVYDQITIGDISVYNIEGKGLIVIDNYDNDLEETICALLQE